MVVVSHRSHRWLSSCLESVAGQCDELIVVDNGSAGGAVSSVAGGHGARVVALSRNLGFPAGVNAGVEAAAGEVVALLNDDAMAHAGWLESALRVLGDRSVAAVAPKLVFALPFAEIRFPEEGHHVAGDARRLGRAVRTATIDGTEVLPHLFGPGLHAMESGVLDGVAGSWRWTSGGGAIYLRLEPGWESSRLLIDGEPAPVKGDVNLINNAGSYLSTEGHSGDHGYLAPDDGGFESPAERFGACGAALVTTREVLGRVGPLAGGFFAYYEDVDWCWRARLAGLKVLYEPAGVVRHVGGASTGGPMASNVVSLAARNRLLCLARNAPLAVAAHQIRMALTAPVPGRLTSRRARALLHLGRAMAERRGLARRRTCSPESVWERWAGVDQTWPVPE
ncbi:MAG TPA: glycosyltransferase family 2 protein [Acidimicrobiales bacterium]|nr:glycosyltransferase family 2 protein [Acidimicrobiales bacterium]